MPLAPNPRHLARRRDDQLDRLSRVTSWVTVGAFGLAGVLSAAVALELPGHTKGATVSSAGTSASGSSAATLPSASSSGGASTGSSGAASGGGLSAPSQAPVQTLPPVTSPPVVSGGS